MSQRGCHEPTVGTALDQTLREPLPAACYQISKKVTAWRLYVLQEGILGHTCTSELRLRGCEQLLWSEIAESVNETTSTEEDDEELQSEEIPLLQLEYVSARLAGAGMFEGGIRPLSRGIKV